MADFNYGQLSQLATPQLRGNSPVGGGGGAGADYYQDRNRHDDLLRRAMEMAAMDAEQKAIDAEEKSLARPGRLADIKAKNSLSEGNLETVPDQLTAMREGARTKALGAERGTREEIEKSLETYATSWTEAKGDKDVQENVIEQMVKDGITRIGVRDVREIPREKLDKLFTNIRNKALNSVKNVHELRKEEVKGQFKLGAAEIAANASIERAHISAEGRRLLEIFKAETKKMTPENKSQWEARMLTLMGEGKMTKGQMEAWTHYQASELAEARAKAANTPPQIDPSVFPPGVLNPPDVPTPPPIPPQQGPTPPPPGPSGPPMDGVMGGGSTMSPPPGPQVAPQGPAPAPAMPPPQGAVPPQIQKAAPPQAPKLDLAAGTFTVGGKTLRIVGESTSGPKRYKLENGIIIDAQGNPVK